MRSVSKKTIHEIASFFLAASFVQGMGCTESKRNILMEPIVRPHPIAAPWERLVPQDVSEYPKDMPEGQEIPVRWEDLVPQDNSPYPLELPEGQEVPKPKPKHKPDIDWHYEQPGPYIENV